MCVYNGKKLHDNKYNVFENSSFIRETSSTWEADGKGKEEKRRKIICSFKLNQNCMLYILCNLNYLSYNLY